MGQTQDGQGSETQYSAREHGSPSEIGGAEKIKEMNKKKGTSKHARTACVVTGTDRSIVDEAAVLDDHGAPHPCVNGAGLVGISAYKRGVLGNNMAFNVHDRWKCGDVIIERTSA